MLKQGRSAKTLIFLTGLAGAFANSRAIAEEGLFVFALQGKGSISSINPHEAYTTRRLAIETQILEGLVRFNPHNPEKPLPLLAEQYFLIDSKTYVFRLRPDALFHPFPGHPKALVTAEDVKFSLDLARRSKSPLAYLLEDIEHTQAVGKNLVKIKLRQPNKSFLSILATPIAHVVPKQYFESLGRDDESRLEAFGRSPVGTGPYWLRGPLARGAKAVVLERFTNYRDQEWARSRDAIARVKFQLYENPKVIVKGILAGDIAMTSLPPTEYADGVDFRKWKGTFITLEPPFLILLAINTGKERLRDPKVRRLLNAAIEKEKVARICPSDPVKLPISFEPYMEIPQKSNGNRNNKLQRLLAQPGMKEHKAKLRASGPFIILAPDRPDHIVDEILASIAGDLRRNLELEVRIVRSPSVTRKEVAARNPDLTYAEWTPDTPWEQDDLAILEPLFKSTSQSNLAFYEDRQIDEYFADARRVNDRASTETLCKKIQIRLREAAPLIWLPSVRHRTLLLAQSYQAAYSAEENGGSASSLIYFTSLLKDVRRRSDNLAVQH